MLLTSEGCGSQTRKLMDWSMLFAANAADSSETSQGETL